MQIDWCFLCLPPGRLAPPQETGPNNAQNFLDEWRCWSNLLIMLGTSPFTMMMLDGWLVVMMVRCVNNNNGDHLVEWRNNTKSDIAKRGSDVDFLVLELFALLHNACQRNDVPEDIGICFWFNFLPSE